MRRIVVLASLFVVMGACATAGSDDIPPDMGDGGQPLDTGVCTSMCNGMCADLKTDTQNCGKCGIACPMGATCVQGTCQCMAGQTKCGSTCVDIKTDLTNCGKLLLSFPVVTKAGRL